MKTKKVFLSVKEKRERLTIRHKRKKFVLKGRCRHCGHQVNWLDIEGFSVKEEKEDDPEKKV